METITKTYYTHEDFNLTHEALEDTIDIKKTDIGYELRYLVLDNDINESSRDWDNLGTMTCFHSSYNLGDEHNFDNQEQMFFSLAENYEDTEILEKMEIEQIQEIVEKNYVMLPLYLYDHSGITMSTGPFSCHWDSGQVGYIYISHADIIKEYGKPMAFNTIEGYLKQEIKTYDQFLTGNVYGIVKETYNVDKEQIDCDSCWMFYGFEDAKQALLTDI